MSPGYPCCCSDPVPGCGFCQEGTTPAQVQLDVPAGTFTNDCASGGCTPAEGTFLLEQRSEITPCVWDSPRIDDLCGNDYGTGNFRPRYTLEILPGAGGTTIVHLDLTNTGNSWRLSGQADPQDCAFSGLTLSQFGSSAGNCTRTKDVTITAL